MNNKNLKQVPFQLPHHIKFPEDYKVINMTGKGFSGKLNKDEVIIYTWLESNVYKIGQTEGEGITPEEAFINRYKNAESAFGGSSIICKRLFICNKKDFPSQKEQYDKQFHIYINKLYEGNLIKFYFPGDKTGNTERAENFNEDNFDLLETCLGNFLNIDRYYLNLESFSFKNKTQEKLFNSAIQVLKTNKKCLFNIVTGFGKSTLVPKFLVEIYKILLENKHKNKKVFLFTSPVIDTISGIVSKVLKNDYGFKIKTFTNKDIIEGDITKRIDEAISQGYLILLIFSVQNLRFRDDNEQNKKQIRKKFSFLSKYKLAAWIRDEKHIEYNGIVTSEIFKNIKSEYILDLTATSFKLLNSFNEYETKEIVKFDLLDALLEKKNGNPDFKNFPSPKMECIDFNYKISDKTIYEIYEDADGYNEKKLYLIKNGKMINEKEYIEINRLKYDGIYLNNGKIVRASKTKNPFAIYSDPEVDNKYFGIKLVPEGNSEISSQEIQEIVKKILNDNIKYYYFITAKEYLKRKEISSYNEATSYFLNIAKSLNKDGFVILTHAQITTGSDLVQLGFEDWDRKISSVDPFFQTIGRLTREYPGKNSVKCYFNIPNMELNYSECIISAIKEKTLDIKKQKEYYDLMPISIISNHPIKLKFEENLKNYYKNIANILSKNGPSVSVLSKLPNIIEYLKNCTFDKLDFKKDFKKDKITPETLAKTTKPSEDDLNFDVNSNDLIFIDNETDINFEDSEKVLVKDKNRLDTISSMLSQGIEIAIIEEKYDIKEVFKHTGIASLYFSKKNIDLINYVLKNEEYYHILNEWFKIYTEHFKKMDLKSVILDGTLFLNQSFKSKMGLVYVPSELSNQIIDKLYKNIKNVRNILVLNALDGKLPLLLQEKYPNAEIICLEYFEHYINNLKKIGFKVYKTKLIEKKLVFPKELKNMKFDVIVGNPPYQIKVGNKKTEPIWGKFVVKSFEYLNENGYLCLVHPSGWRNVDGRFNYIKQLLLSKQIKYLEIHDEKDGIKTFKSMTRYDWYICKNLPYSGNKTQVKFQNGEIVDYDLNELPFIPNGSLELLKKLIAKKNDDKINVMYSLSIYDSRLPIISKEKTSKNKYPIIYSITKGDKLNLLYSSENKGHIGIPKFIWSNGFIPSFGCVIDREGKYGMSPFCYSIVDSPENLDNIKKAFDSKKFRSLMKDCMVSDSNVNRRVISLFKKDFWKYFVDENGNEI